MPPKRRGSAATRQQRAAAGDSAKGASAAPSTPVPPRPPPGLSSKRHLVVETLLPRGIFLLPGFLSPGEVAAARRSLEAFGLAPTPPPPPAQAAEYAVRRMKRCAFDSPAYVDELWAATGLGDLLETVDLGVEGQLVGLNPALRGYRYDVGDRFGRHYDGSHAVADPRGGGGALQTEYTLLVYLGDEQLEGGETGGRAGEGGEGDEALDVPVDDMEELAVAPRPGMLLLHRHGDACLLHEGRRVTAGAKYILRTDLVFRVPE
eukprot:jgi/Tetstr1/421976/TSEL_001222.t1